MMKPEAIEACRGLTPTMDTISVFAPHAVGEACKKIRQ